MGAERAKKWSHSDLYENLIICQFQGLTNSDLIELAKKLKIGNFSNVLLRDILPNSKNVNIEIVNFDTFNEPVTVS